MYYEVKITKPDQTAASDLGLHCLPITILLVYRPEWVIQGFKCLFNPGQIHDICILFHMQN